MPAIQNHKMAKTVERPVANEVGETGFVMSRNGCMEMMEKMDSSAVS
jgi:hypothetical protein